MLKCLSAQLHTTSYLVRFLAKTCNRFKRAAIREYAAMRTATLDCGGKHSMPLLHPCISDDGLVLAPNRMQATRAPRSTAKKRTNNHQNHKQTNKSYADAGSNSIVLALETPSPSLLAMAGDTTTTTAAPYLQGMPDGPHEDPSPTGTQGAPSQLAATRPTAVVFLGICRRDHALKTLCAEVLRNKAQNQRHNAFKKWIQHIEAKIDTAHLVTHTARKVLAEALRKWHCLRTYNDERRNNKNAASALNARRNNQEQTSYPNDWGQNAQDSSTARPSQVQLFLRGAADSTLTITVPVPVTRNQLHKIISKKTLVPPQGQSLGSMYQYADPKIADLFYMKTNCTLDISFLLKGGSGGPSPAKQAKPPLHQSGKFFIYIHGPDRHQNTVMVLTSDKIRRVKEILEDRVGLHPSSQTLFLHGKQLDDYLILEEAEIIQGTTLQLLRDFPPVNCEEHLEVRDPEDLVQRYDPDRKWIWVCCPDATCRTQGPSQNNVGAATNALTQHPAPLRAKRTPTLSQRFTTAAESPSGQQLQTPLPDTPQEVGTRVYARYAGDNQEYSATIRGNYTGGHLVAFDIEPEASYRVMNAHVRPIPLTLAPSIPLAPGQGMCGLHHKPRSLSNLTRQSNPLTTISHLICKPGRKCTTRSERLDNAEHYGPHAGSDTATNQNNLEAGTDDTSSTSSWDGTSKQRLSAKATVNERRQRGKTLIKTKASTVIHTAPLTPERDVPASTPAPVPRARVRQVTPSNNEDLSPGMDARHVRPQKQGLCNAHFSYRELNTVQQVGNSLNPIATLATGAQQPPPTQPETGDTRSVVERLALMNIEVGGNAVSHCTLPHATAPPLLGAHRIISLYVHGGKLTLAFQQSPDTTIAQLKLEIQHRTEIPANEQTLSFKEKIMEDLTALRDYDLIPDEPNIIDLSVGMRGAAAPRNVPHMPLPPEAPPPSGKTSDLSANITTEEHTSSPEDAASPSERDRTTTKISFCERILDEYSSSALKPELSKVVRALAQLSALAPQRAQTSQQQEMRAPTAQVLNAPLQPTPPPMELGGGAGQGEPQPAPQRVQMPQRQVLGAPKDQIINAPLYPTPPQMELENGAGLEEPSELTQPPTGVGVAQKEIMVPVPCAHELPSQGASTDTPMPRKNTFTVLNGLGHDLSFILPSDTTIASLKQAIQRATGVPASRQVLSSQGKEMHGSETLRDHKLTPSSSIVLTMKLVKEMIQFFVSTPDGKSITLLDSIDATGGQLKARLEAKIGIPAAQQILTYTEEIQDSTTLREISLPAKGTIYMSLRLIGGPEKERTPTLTQPQRKDAEMVQFFVQNLNGSSLTMREPYETTGGQLKARLQIRTGIPAAQQRLTYASVIQDLATLREVSLTENGTIRISLRLAGGMEDATKRQITYNSIYARSIGISVTHTPQGFEITDIAEDSPADKEARIRRGLLLVKIGDSLGNLRDLDSAGEALSGTPNTPVKLVLKTKLNIRPFEVSLVRQQGHLSGLTVNAGGESPRSPLHLPRSKRVDQSKSPVDTSPSPANPAQRPEEESQLPSRDQAYTRALLDSIQILTRGQSKNGYVLQRQLAKQFYQKLSTTGTGTEIKQRLQQKYGVEGAFSRFLKACTHPNGEPLLEWKDTTLTELRITTPTKAPMSTSHTLGLNNKEPAGDLPSGCLRLKPKRPRLATNTSPPSTKSLAGEMPPSAKAALIRSFSAIWVPGFDPKTAEVLRLAVERCLHLPKDSYLPYQRALVVCYNELAKLHCERSSNGKPQPQQRDMEHCLKLNQQGRVYHPSTAFAFRQTLPNGQGYQDYHAGDFVHIRHHDSPHTQLVQILHAVLHEEAAKTASPFLKTLRVQPWTDLNGQYLQDKTGRLTITANQAWRRQTTAFPSTALDPDTFFENARLTYLDLLLFMRVSKTWKQGTIKGMRHLRTLSLNPASTVPGPRRLPQASDAAFELALQRTEPQHLKVIDLRSQSTITPPAIRRMLESHPRLESVLISSPALAFAAVATKMMKLPGLLGKRPRLLSKALRAFIESKERATAEAGIEPEEGPTSIQYLLDELALFPGTQLSIDPELVPPLHVFYISAKVNEWATMALFIHGRMGRERARRDTQIPDQQGDTALHIACAHGSSDVVEILLSDPDISVASALGKYNHIAETPIMGACRAGHADIVTRLLHSAPPTIHAPSLFRKVRHDGHTFLTAAIASQNSSLLQLALDQSPFELIDPNQLKGATTYQGKLCALANAATCPLQIEKWLRGAEKLTDKSAHSVLRTLASITDAPTAPTLLRTALTNILAIMAQHWSILAYPCQRSPLQRHRYGAQYALPWPPSIILAQLGAQGPGQSVSQPPSSPTRDLYLPIRTVLPMKESRPHNPNRDIFTSKGITLRMALSHDSHTLVRQEADLLTAADTATGLTTAFMTTKQHGNTGALNFVSLQFEDQPSAAGHLSVLLVDEKGTIFRWIPEQNSLQADYQHTDLPDKEALQACAVAFTRNASALAYVSQEGTLHVSHFRPAGEGCNPTAGITARHNYSRRPVSNQGIHAMALSNSLLALSTTSGTTLWDGVRRDSHAKNGFADFICRRVLDGQFDEKDKKKPRREPCSLAFSGNGEYLATGCRGEMPGYDGTGSVIEIWNVVPGTLAFQLRTTHQKGVHALVFSTDTLLVSAGGEDHTTQVWHLDIHAAKCSPLLQVWQGDTHTALRSTPLLGRQAKITDLVASERLIMASSADLTTMIWNVPHAPPKSTAHKEEVKAVAISPSHANPNSIFGTAATAAGRTVKIWDAQDTLQATIPHITAVRAITFSASGEHLVVAGSVPHVYVHASSTGDLLLRIASPQPSQNSTAHFTTLAVPENDKYLAAGTSIGAIAIWTNAIPPSQRQNRSQAQRLIGTQTGLPACKHIAGHLEPITRLEFVDENTLLSRSTKNVHRMWDSRSAEHTSTGHHPLTLTEFSREGQRKGILDIRFRGNRLFIAMPTHTVAFFLNPTNITAVACQGTRIVIGGKDGSVIHAEASWLDMPQARARGASRNIRIDVSRFARDGEHLSEEGTEKNFSITAPAHLSIRDLRTIVATRVFRPTTEVFFSQDRNTDAQRNLEDEPIYESDLGETIYASPVPVAADHTAPHEPQAIIRLFISPPLDLAQNPPNKNKERTFHLDIPVSSTIATLYAIIARRISFHESWFHLRAHGTVFSGPLEAPSPDTGNTLLEKGITNGDTIHVHMKLQAGSETYPGNSQPGTEGDEHRPHCENMQVLVTTYDGRTSAIPTKPTDTVESLKRTLAKWQEVPVWRQRIVFAGMDLLNEHTLEHYKLGNNSALAQMLRMHGGMDPYTMLTNRAKKQAVLRQEEEAAKDPSGFAKTDAHQQDIHQKNQAKKMAEEERALAKAQAQTRLNSQFEALIMEESNASACPLAATPALVQAASLATSAIYKQAANRNLSSRTIDRLFLHIRARIQEGLSTRSTNIAPLDRAARTQFLIAEPTSQTESYAQAITVEHIQEACENLTSALTLVEVSDPHKRNLPQLFKITCAGTLAPIVPRLEHGYITVHSPGKTYFCTIEQQFDPALQLVMRATTETNHEWTLVLSCLIGMGASPTQVQDAILAMVRASHPNTPTPIGIRMEQSKRVGDTWYRAAVPDIIQKKGKGHSFTPKLTAVYANSADVSAALGTLLQVNIENAFEGKSAASSEKDESLIVKLHLSTTNYQPRQAEGIEGATDALRTRRHTHQERLQTILEHIPKILQDLHLAQISRKDAITELSHQATDVRSISPTHIPLAHALDIELHHLGQDTSLDLTEWLTTSRSLQNLALLQESPCALATVGPMPTALSQYNRTNYPRQPAKKLEKVLELFVKAAAEEGLYLTAAVWVKELRIDPPRQILVALDESAASKLKIDAPSGALTAVLAALTSTYSAPLQLIPLKKKLQATAVPSQPTAATGPLSAYPPKIQEAAVTIYNLLVQGELVWVHTSNQDGSPIQINSNFTPKTALRTAHGPLYIGNMCPEQEPIQVLAALVDATATATGKVRKVDSYAISPLIRVFGLSQMLLILTAGYSRSIPEALAPATTGQVDPTAFIAKFMGQSTAHLVNLQVNDHYARTALALAEEKGIWLSSPAMASPQGPPLKHQPLQDHEAYEKWSASPALASPYFSSSLSGHIGESSRPTVDTSLEDHTFDLSLLQQIISEGTLQITHKDGHSLVTPGRSDLLPAIERTPQQAGKRVLWHLLDVTASEAKDAAVLLLSTLRAKDTPIHIRTSPDQEIDELLMSLQVGPDSLASHTTSNILTKGEWGQAPLDELIRNATRERTSTAHHTKLPDGSGHLLLLTPSTWTNAPVRIDVMYGQEWIQTARRAASERGIAGDILRQAKIQAAKQVILDEVLKEPIYIEGAGVVNDAIKRTGPPSANDPRADPTSLSHGSRTQHPYNASSDGAASTAALEALENLCRANLLTATPYLKGLLFSPCIPATSDSGESHGDSSDEMSDGEKDKTPKGKVGTAAKPPL